MNTNGAVSSEAAPFSFVAQAGVSISPGQAARAAFRDDSPMFGFRSERTQPAQHLRVLDLGAALVDLDVDVGGPIVLRWAHEHGFERGRRLKGAVGDQVHRHSP